MHSGYLHSGAIPEHHPMWLFTCSSSSTSEPHILHKTTWYQTLKLAPIPYHISITRCMDLVKAERERVIANLWDAILVWWMNKTMFQLYLLKYMLKTILIIAINHITPVKQLSRLSGANFGKYLHFGRLTFVRKKINV